MQILAGKENESNENNAGIIGEFPVQNLVKQVEISRRMTYIVHWYDYDSDAEIMERL